MLQQLPQMTLHVTTSVRISSRQKRLNSREPSDFNQGYWRIGVTDKPWQRGMSENGRLSLYFPSFHTFILFLYIPFPHREGVCACVCVWCKGAAWQSAKSMNSVSRTSVSRSARSAPFHHKCGVKCKGPRWFGCHQSLTGHQPFILTCHVVASFHPLRSRSHPPPQATHLIQSSNELTLCCCFFFFQIFTSEEQMPLPLCGH